MRPQFVQRTSEFFAKWGSLENAYLSSHGLHRVKFNDYQHLLGEEDLHILLETPCPTHYPQLNYKYIRLMKLFRGFTGVREELVCRNCPRQQECKLSFQPMSGRPSIAELLRLSRYILQSPATEIFYLTSYMSFISSLDQILVTLLVNKNTRLRLLKTVEVQTKEAIAVQHKPKLPQKLVWKPTKKDLEREAKLSKTLHRTPQTTTSV